MKHFLSEMGVVIITFSGDGRGLDPRGVRVAGTDVAYQRLQVDQDSWG